MRFHQSCENPYNVALITLFYYRSFYYTIDTSFFYCPRKTRKILFEVEKGFKPPKHIENNVFIIYMPNRTKLRPGEDVETQMKIGFSIPKDIIYTVIFLPLFHKIRIVRIYD